MKSFPLPLTLLALFLVAGGAIALTGCSESSAVDAQTVAKYRTNFVLADEPDGAQTVISIREQLAGQTSDGHEAAHDDHAQHEKTDEGDHDSHAHHEEGEHGDHDHDGDEHADHDHSADLADDADDDHADAHEHGADEHGHDEHTQGESEHVDHDHDGDGLPDHPPWAHGGADPIDVVMVGLVGGIANVAKETQPEFPFVKDYAIVTLVDPEAASGGHEHADGEECAFCAAHAGDKSAMLATVKFTNESGKVLPVDARDLFDIKEKDVVVVRGKARLDHDGTLIVDATGLYVRR